MSKKSKLLGIVKIAILGIASFSVGLLVTVVVLTSLPFQFWKSFDASQISQSIRNLPGNITLPRLYIVQSGSMEPAIKTGSVVVSYPAENYVQDDVITFAPNGDSGKLITHRIVFKLYPDGADSPPKYITGGDTNEDFDTWNVKDEHIVGKSILSVPYLGYLANYAKTPYGFLLLVIVPATIIIYEELKSLLTEIRKLLKNIVSATIVKLKKNKQLAHSNVFRPDGSETKSVTHHQDRPIASKKQALSRASILIPVFGSALVFTGLASSYFSDIENSIGNIFQASESFGDNGNDGNGNGGITEVPDNLTCQSSGYTFGFKIAGVDMVEDGVYTLTSDDGKLSVGAPEDSNNSITLDNIILDDEGERQLFDWLSTLGIDAVIVKGGENANLYTYDPEAFSDTGLHAPAKPPPPPNKFFEISHIEFCYDYDVVIKEFMPNPTSPEEDWVELYSDVDTNISGYILDDANTVTDMAVIPDNTFIGPSYGKHFVVDVSNRLNQDSDTIFLYLPDNPPNARFLLGSVSYSGTPAPNTSIGRDPDGTGPFGTCSTSTKGLSNTGFCHP